MHVSAKQEPVVLGYRHDVASYRGNKKLARKEAAKGVRLTAVQITNNTDRPLIVGQDVQLLINAGPASPLATGMVYHQLRQSPPLFLFYLALTPTTITSTRLENGYYQENHFPIGLILGPALALGNMVRASKNNDKFLRELHQYDIMGKTIYPGETIYGLVGLNYSTHAPLSIMIVEPPTASSQDYY
jgi:hypothetical protein